MSSWRSSCASHRPGEPSRGAARRPGVGSSRDQARQRRYSMRRAAVSERTEPDPAAVVAAARDLLGVDHPAILATTVCSIVEHGGELLMVRQLNREGDERWNFPTGWMAPLDEDGHVAAPRALGQPQPAGMETGYAASARTLIGVSLVREHDPDGHRVGTSLRLNYLSASRARPATPSPTRTSWARRKWFPPAEIEDRSPQGGQGRADRCRLPPLAGVPPRRQRLRRRHRHPELTSARSATLRGGPWQVGFRLSLWRGDGCR